MLMKYFPNCRSVFICHCLATSQSSNCVGETGGVLKSELHFIGGSTDTVDSTASGKSFNSKDPQTMLH